MSRKRICFKCHREVAIENDAGHLGYLVFGEATGSQCGSRTIHFLPVIEDSVVVCIGSPYRAQYIEGQPRDNGGYWYFKSHEASIRAAHQKLQELAKKLKEKSSPQAT